MVVMFRFMLLEWGVPYPNMIEEGKFDRFDFILHRNGSDHQRLVARLGAHRVKAFPDLGFLLPQWSSPHIVIEPYMSLLGGECGFWISKEYWSVFCRGLFIIHRIPRLTWRLLTKWPTF